MNILIVEDDNDINKLLAEILESEGYNVKSAYSGTEAIMYLKLQDFEMILLDLMLPGLGGEKVLLEIRENKNMPIIIISAKDDKLTKIEMLKSGADDFISKPFDIDEVVARVETNLRRYRIDGSSNSKENDLIFNEINLNIDTRVVTVNSKGVNLTSREFDILKLFIDNPKKVFTKSNIFESIWEEDYMGDDNTINVHISNLRNKISKHAEYDYIQTIWGIGYKLEV